MANGYGNGYGGGAYGPRNTGGRGAIASERLAAPRPLDAPGSNQISASALSAAQGLRQQQGATPLSPGEVYALNYRSRGGSQAPGYRTYGDQTSQTNPQQLVGGVSPEMQLAQQQYLNQQSGRVGENGIGSALGRSGTGMYQGTQDYQITDKSPLPTAEEELARIARELGQGYDPELAAEQAYQSYKDIAGQQLADQRARMGRHYGGAGALGMAGELGSNLSRDAALAAERMKQGAFGQNMRALELASGIYGDEMNRDLDRDMMEQLIQYFGSNGGGGGGTRTASPIGQGDTVAPHSFGSGTMFAGSERLGDYQGLSTSEWDAELGRGWVPLEYGSDGRPTMVSYGGKRYYIDSSGRIRLANEQQASVGGQIIETAEGLLNAFTGPQSR